MANGKWQGEGQDSRARVCIALFVLEEKMLGAHISQITTKSSNN